MRLRRRAVRGREPRGSIPELATVPASDVSTVIGDFRERRVFDRASRGTLRALDGLLGELRFK